MKFGLTYTARSEAATRSRTLTSDDAEEEFDSPETIEAIAEAIRQLGHDVELLGDGVRLAKRLCAGDLPDFVFNLAEGRGISRNREAWVPALLEMFDIPHTGSDALTLAATLDKDCAKKLVATAGVQVPAGIVLESLTDLETANLKPSPFGRGQGEGAGNVRTIPTRHPHPNPLPTGEGVCQLQYPLIVKPALEGSSKGIRNASLIERPEQLDSMLSETLETYRQPVLVEEFIDGDELTVGVLGNAPAEVLGIMRVVPLTQRENFVYSLEVKRDWRRQVRYETPAKLSDTDTAAVREATLTAFRALGCRDVARIDFRLRNCVPYFLEANPLPGLSPGTSDLVLMADAVGISYGELIGRIVDAAVARVAASGEALSAC